MTRAEIAAMEPGPELYALVSDAVGRAPGAKWGRSMLENLVAAAEAAGLGWTVVLAVEDGFVAFLQTGGEEVGSPVECAQTAGGSEVVFYSENTKPATGKTPQHAACLAVALAGAES
ncbi:MAG: hypothetical protein O7A04_09365 [Acidobacteria bacterium]|nr:hypothetical protein [Acidobacteriota bacterium]